ncbi:MAG: DDE-type integrase/transposase/recombinase [Synechococcus sp.]
MHSLADCSLLAEIPVLTESRAIDSDGNLVDSRLSQTQDMEAAKAFFQQALEVAEEPPEHVVTDDYGPYLKAIKEELGKEVGLPS